jgi:hypothetical protein
VVAFFLTVLLCDSRSFAYSVLTHEKIVDMDLNSAKEALADFDQLKVVTPAPILAASAAK